MLLLLISHFLLMSDQAAPPPLNDNHPYSHFIVNEAPARHLGFPSAMIYLAGGHMGMPSDGLKPRTHLCVNC